MKILGVHLKNWMPFRGDHGLDLPGGAIAVVARYGDDPRRSNRAGKTAFLEAIEWCLYGVHRKRLDDDVISEGEDETEVTVTLADGPEVIANVIRSRKRGSATRLTVRTSVGASAQKVAEDEIGEVLGFGHTDYRATANFAQGDIEAIVSRTSGERRKLIAEWLDLDVWEQVATRVRDKAQNATANLEDLRRQIAELGEVEYTEADIRADIEASEKELKKAKAELTALDLRKIEQVAAHVAAKNEIKRLDELKATRKELAEELHGLGVPAETVKNAQDEYNEAADKHRALTDTIKNLNNLARGGFDGQCPIMCKPCPAAEEVRSATDEYRKRSLETDQLRTVESFAMFERNRRLQEMHDRNRKVDKLTPRFNAVTEEIRRLTKAAEDIGPDLDVDVEELKRQRDKWTNAVAQQSADIRDAERDLEQLQTWHQTKSALEASLKNAERLCDVTRLALKALGPTGIASSIAEVAIGSLEERVAALLAPSGLSVQFAWDRPAKGLEAACWNCGHGYKGQRDKSCPVCHVERRAKRTDELEILVTDGTKAPEDVRADSGGGKVLVASAIRLAAAAMLRERRGARCAWATIDEPFGPLDTENREMLARAFAGMLGSVGLEQAFVVSHDSALLDALPARIEVVRVGGTSTVRVVE